jgi:hypothetical protein
MQCYLTINSQIRDCRACRDGESRKRRKSNARVESGVEQDQRASGLLLVLTKAAVHCQSDIRFESGEMFFFFVRMGVETYRMNLENKAYQ